MIARLSQGGMRDSLNMLEYCAGDGGDITVEKAERLLGAASRTLLASLTGAVSSGNIANALSVIDEVYLSSRDIAVFWRELISFCRDMLVAIGTKMANVKDEILRRCAEQFTLPKLLYIIEIFMSAEADMQRNPSGVRLYAEMALIRACDSSLSEIGSALIERISALEDRIATGNFAVPKEYPGRMIPEPAENAESIVQTIVAAPRMESPDAASFPEKTEEKPKKQNNVEIGGRKLKNFKKWQEVVRRLSATEGLFVPFLQMAYAYEGSDGKFYLFFENNFAVTLMTEDRKKSICNAVNAAGGCNYIPSDIIGSVREDVGGIREPIEDLLEMDEIETEKQ